MERLPGVYLGQGTLLLILGMIQIQDTDHDPDRTDLHGNFTWDESRLVSHAACAASFLIMRKPKTNPRAATRRVVTSDVKHK